MVKNIIKMLSLNFEKLIRVGFILLVVFFKQNNAARILAMVPTASYSHQNAFYPLWKELSLRGHQVTLITADPINNSSLTNLTEIDMHDLAYGIWNKHLEGTFEEGSEGLLSGLTEITKAQLEVVESELNHPRIQAIIKNQTEYFDLFMVEISFPVLYAFAERFKCPFILLSSMDGFSQIFNQIGSPSHPVTNPDIWFPSNEILTFRERLISVSLVLIFNSFSYYYQETTALSVKKNFGLGYSDMTTYGQNASMLFLNSDPIFSRVRPLSPNVIQFGGGTHIKPLRPLSKNLKTVLDSATEGFIYFSLGTNIKSKDLPPNVLSAIIETFSELPYKILWKFENDKLSGLPKNVVIFKWLPQQDVLRHPNIKLFITQGGLQSLEESLHCHVPIVGLPFFADQPANIQRAVYKGIGLSADPFSLKKENFKNIIMEVINNSKYRYRVKQLSDLIHDQPMTGLERAIWWTEYVIRYKGADHFRSPALDIPFYQYYLLDVILFYIVIIVVILYILIALLKLMYKICKSLFGQKTKIKYQ